MIIMFYLIQTDDEEVQVESIVMRLQQLHLKLLFKTLKHRFNTPIPIQPPQIFFKKATY